MKSMRKSAPRSVAFTWDGIMMMIMILVMMMIVMIIIIIILGAVLKLVAPLFILKR